METPMYLHQTGDNNDDSGNSMDPRWSSVKSRHRFMLQVILLLGSNFYNVHCPKGISAGARCPHILTLMRMYNMTIGSSRIYVTNLIWLGCVWKSRIYPKVVTSFMILMGKVIHHWIFRIFPMVSSKSQPVGPPNSPLRPSSGWFLRSNKGLLEKISGNHSCTGNKSTLV